MYSGLMFRKPYNVLFVLKEEQRVKLHTWFVLGTIDVYLLNTSGLILEARKGLKPFKTWESNMKAKMFVETPQNALGLFSGEHIQLPQNINKSTTLTTQ